MTPIRFENGQLMVEAVPAADIARAFGTPTYVYSTQAITDAYTNFTTAFSTRDIRVCYAVKANSNLGVLSLLANLGAGFDIVSLGELERVTRAGGDPRKVVFSGVGKQDVEIAGALNAGIACFNIESASELTRIERVAKQLGFAAPISVRVNPDVDPKTHPYISTGMKENKFGVGFDAALELYRYAAASDAIEIRGVDCHIGSQITNLDPFREAITRVRDFTARLGDEGIAIDHIDLGGGIGVSYQGEPTIEMADYANAVTEIMAGCPQQLMFEPGRSLVADAGLLLCRVVTLKENEGKHFAVVDAAMNDLLRPALYDAWQAIEPVSPRDDATPQTYDVVGPICESGDFIGAGRELAIREEDLLAVRSCGAYGFVMSSNYNSRNRAAEVMVKGEAMQCVRDRESFDDQLRLERPLTL